MIVALYARVSTARQAEMDLSIPDQVRQIREWATREGHSVAVEYIEPGASATDDRRPVFQQMIAEATASPNPFEAVVVHSLSRFFRDSMEFAYYERKLKRTGVRLISITQQTSDDPAGEMARKMFSMFDEYQSKENAKHTLRAMQENARQGFFNGSRAPFGYRAVDTEIVGSRGTLRKKLAVDPAEAAIVRRVFELYLDGYLGNTLGYLGIARLLNRQGITFRGKEWSASRVDQLLTNRAYIGQYHFNKRWGKQLGWKPEAEWIRTEVEPIIEESLFDRAKARRASRDPERVPPRVVSSPTLLTGLLRCGVCGSGMTIATGKGGHYRYYKCAARSRRASDCNNANAPMRKVDEAVLATLKQRVLTDSRVTQMLLSLKEHRIGTDATKQAHLRQLGRELEQAGRGLERLYEAVETGMLPMDATLTERAHKLKARREEILTQMAGIRREAEMPKEMLSPKNVRAFCEAMRKRLDDPGCNFGKEYLRLFVKEIRITGKEIRMRGGFSSMAHAMAKKELGTPEGVPRFIPEWRAQKDSNLRPSDS